MSAVLRRSIPTTWFVICWILLFQYETLRANYLSPLFKRELPKFRLLFPPAGWIMFFNVDRSYGFAEVYGIPGGPRLADHGSRGGEPVLLDPHDIFATKAVGYDNIRRNVLVTALSRDHAPVFCRFLRRKFPAYDSFVVVYAEYPDLINSPDRLLRQIAYRCQ